MVRKSRFQRGCYRVCARTGSTGRAVGTSGDLEELRRGVETLSQILMMRVERMSGRGRALAPAHSVLPRSRAHQIGAHATRPSRALSLHVERGNHRDDRDDAVARNHHAGVIRLVLVVPGQLRGLHHGIVPVRRVHGSMSLTTRCESCGFARGVFTNSPFSAEDAHSYHADAEEGTGRVPAVTEEARPPTLEYRHERRRGGGRRERPRGGDDRSTHDASRAHPIADRRRCYRGNLAKRRRSDATSRVHRGGPPADGGGARARAGALPARGGPQAPRKGGRGRRAVLPRVPRGDERGAREASRELQARGAREEGDARERRRDAARSAAAHRRRRDVAHRRPRDGVDGTRAARAQAPVRAGGHRTTASGGTRRHRRGRASKERGGGVREAGDGGGDVRALVRPAAERGARPERRRRRRGEGAGAPTRSAW